MITVRVSDLKNMVEELEKEEIEYVDITEFEESKEENGDITPKVLHFLANDGYGGGIDFEVIEHIDISAFYKAEREQELE